MATNLLIGNAGVGINLTSVSVNNTAHARYPVKNLFGGTKPDYFKLATATSGDTRITINTTSQTTNFLYLAKAITLKNDDVGTITVKGHSSDNYGAATTVATISSFGSATMIGTDSDDYLATWATSSSFPWWYINYNASAVSLIMHSKAFLGQSFDPGKDPTGTIVSTRVKPLGVNRRSKLSFDISWEGISYAKAVEMYQKFYRPRRRSPIVLYTVDYHDILFDKKAIFGRVLDMTVPPRQTDYCDVTMSVEELP
ncbi:MAG: hypothetical protein E6R03_09715 [Hyphomicrobiaceae bacterium]|nr:MAG: hypothetical protein E6R03_09715 [Hyphomicrobiaceae bacterium]